MHHDDGPYLTARLALLPGARYYVTHFDSASGSKFYPSPGMAMQAPAERLTYIALLNNALA